MENNSGPAVNIGLVCSEELMAAMESNPELNDAVNRVIERFFNADWGDVSEETAEKNNNVIATLEGKIEAEYKSKKGDFAVEMTFTDKENATVTVGRL